MKHNRAKRTSEYSNREKSAKEWKLKREVHRLKKEKEKKREGF